jgi:hypothetical protein
VFAAALGQFDELLTAASVVGPASAPLPLYYALNQAGRAVAAAHQADPARWQPKRHGLSVAHRPGALESTMIEPWKPGKGKPRDDSFSVMADTIGSPLLTGAVRLGALWAAAPGAERVTGLGAHRIPAAEMVPFGAGTPTFAATLRGQWPVGLPTGTLRQRLRRAYPAARDSMEVVAVQPVPGSLPDESDAVLRWLSPTGDVRAVDEVAARFPGPGAALYLMPGLGSNNDALAPLMVWWALLYALSHLARYQPATWSKALDPVRSTLAVPVEASLAYVREVLPCVVLSELVR